jgi:hypothetical protein
MQHAPPTFVRVTLLGVVATAAGIDLFSMMLHSSWVLPLGILLGSALTLIVLLLGPRKPLCGRQRAEVHRRCRAEKPPGPLWEAAFCLVFSAISWERTDSILFVPGR